MSNQNKIKLKLMYLRKILLELTDDTKGITMPEILKQLESYGIKAERKSIYSDLEYLRQYGMDIIGEQHDKAYWYRVGNRDFELAELKLLVDSVQAAKFITPKKSNLLIQKIEGLGSRNEASLLHRQVYVAERVKTENESIYYNVDKLHEAIGNNVKITFQYFQWDADKQMVLRRDGAPYEVSPWALSWDDENYYLVAFDSEENKIKHFRVDKMLKIELQNKPREGKSLFDRFDIALYTKRRFGMFDGEEENVKLLCDNRMAGIIIDRFGKDVFMHRTDKEHFSVSVKVAVSRQFIAWVFSLGDGIAVVSPEQVVKKVKEEVDRLCQLYK